MLDSLDRLSDFCGKLAALLFVAIGVMIAVEVVARDLLLSPTSWAEELSRFLQIWATYLAAGYLLRHRRLIRVNVLRGQFGARAGALLDGFTLVFIAAFCCVAIGYGTGIVIESIQVGRASASMLALPRWTTESAVPVGFGVLLLQCVSEFARLVTGTLDSGQTRGASD